MGKTVLVIAPHALDEVLGCGGTMARHSDEGDTVHTLVLFGDGSGRDTQRRINALAAAKILGSNAPIFAGFPENRSDTISLVDIVTVIERCIDQIKPQTVYTCHGANLNIDHQTSFKATVTAIRPVPGSPVHSIFTYEILSSTDWATVGFGRHFHPAFFVEIGEQIKRKIDSLKLYGDEIRSSPHARSLEVVKALAKIRGGNVGFTFGESFELVRMKKPADSYDD